MERVVLSNEAEVIYRLTSEIEQCAKRALSEAGVFRVGISGGSVVNFLCNAIPRINCDLSKWKFFFCDERYVPESDAESTYGVYKRTLLPVVSKLQAEQFVPVNTDYALEQCADDYEARIIKEFGVSEKDIPQFDLLLLGMGPDGHTCSLFPGSALLKEEHLLIAPVEDSPKPPPERVTMTLPLINNAKCCIFAVCGSGKADVVKRIFVDKEPLPASMVAPKNGKVIWIFDNAAASYLF